MTDIDCDRFEELVIDVLYDEDGPDVAAARAHAATCDRCGPVLASLREAREIVALPPMAVPPGLDERILSVAQQPEGPPPRFSWARVLDRFISLAGAYAMRPQVAMGALLLLMVGSSLLLLRARPAGPGAVRITEDGVPHGEADRPRVAAAQAPVGDRRAAPEPHGKADERGARADAPSPREAPAAPPPAAIAAAPADPAREAPAASGAGAPAEPAPTASAAAAPPEDAAYASAMDDYKARRFSDAAKGFEIVANGGGTNAPSAALYAARSTRFSAGCGAALPKLDAVSSRYAGTSVAAEATWDAATCYREVGQIDRARQLFQALRRVAGYRDRAEKELKALAQSAGPAKASKAKPSGASDTAY